MEEIDFNSPEYKRSRVAYVAQCTFEYFVSLLVTDAFLAKLLTNIGLSDSSIGIISSVISLAFIVQLFAIILVRSKISTKKIIIFFDTLSQLFFASMFLIPFIPVSKTVRQVLVIVAILLAYIFKYLITSITFKWANSYVQTDKRASFSAKKEMVSLVSGIVFTMIIGYILDNYEAMDNLEGGFIFISIAILVVCICNFISLLLIKKESEKETNDSRKPWPDVFKNTLGNKGFRNVIILTVLWDCARYFTAGFLGVFKTNDLLLSVFAVQIINMIANACRFALSIPFGRYSDKKSFAKGFELAMILCTVAFFFCMLTTPKTWFFIIFYTVLHHVSVAGSNQNSFNITYSYVNIEYVTQAMAIKSCIGGTCGFISAIIGGKILQAIQNNGNMVFGFHIYGQQVLAAVSMLLTLAAALFLHFVIAKQQVKKQ